MQEIDHKADRTYNYIYSHPNSYEPLAQVYTENGEQVVNYFHCDQIGIPREMTDSQGNIIWKGSYYARGQLKSNREHYLAHQPFRLQNQYFDQETGLHYNFFRYYNPILGRFINQDPIGLAGGENLYRFANNAQSKIDPLGLTPNCPFGSAESLQGLATQAKGQQILQQIHEKAYFESEGSIGLETNLDISLIKKLNGAVGAILTKNKNSNAVNVCAYASKCDGVEIGGGGSLSLQGVISDAGTTSGVSHSMCAGVSGSVLGGVAGSACIDGVGGKSLLGGIQAGAGLGANTKQCVQFTKCTDF
ncbi:RHS repeat domain-containing protein [Actinobacillus vicugnae]|uniref:RHS repeat domain-containing protein n=1 Tax=Actinobacillus vicugnae TaxID=2573093 RepID=UPI001FCA7F00|nr:RHS repeat-associated core domain-containing protein [Actinobacillus vicugnae]